MGCDIHVIIEQQEYEKWWAFAELLLLNRNYAMFAALAGVRETEQRPAGPIPPKGLPDGLSFHARESFDQDTHSHSWLTHDELATVLKFYGAESDEWEEILGLLKPNRRLVFAFDN
jgi:hypothetical protein